MPMRLWYLTRYHFWPLIDQAQDEARIQRFPAQSPLFEARTADETGLILKRGHVRVRRMLPDLGLQTVEVVNAGEALGLTRSNSAEPDLELAEVMDETEAYVFTREEMAQRVARTTLPPSSVTARSFLLIRRIDAPVDEMLFQPLETRIARVLLMLTRRYPGPAVPAGRTIGLRMPAWRLADLTESNRELVRLIVDDWARRGWIGFRRRKMVLHDEGRLETLAKGL